MNQMAFLVLILLNYELSCLGKGDEVCSKRKKILDHPYGSFKGLKDAGRDSDEKTRENSLKSSLPRMLSSVSFNDKILNASNMGANSQRRPSAVFRLSFKRRSSCDREETVEHCKHSKIQHIKVILSIFANSYITKLKYHCHLSNAGQSKRFLFRPRAGHIIPCCTGDKTTTGCWSEIPPSTFKLRGENYFK